MLAGPDVQGFDVLDERLAEVGETVIDMPCRLSVSFDQAVLLQPAQCLGQHLPRDASDENDEFAVPARLTAESEDRERGPLIGQNFRRQTDRAVSENAGTGQALHNIKVPGGNRRLPSVDRAHPRSIIDEESLMPRVIVFDEFGGPDVMHVVDEPITTPASGEVRVRIEAFAVNPLDLMMRSGASPAPVPLPHARLGIEATGIVDAVGPEVTGLSTGTPVILTAVADPVAQGTYAEYTTVPASQVIPRPAELNVVEAAAIWVAFSTAYGALVETAAMRRGDRVLINAATGAVGRAAIQVAREVGAFPIALTRNSANEDELFKIGAAAVIATDRDNLIETVGHHTDGVGVDIILDLVTGPGQRQLSEVARTGATLLAAGFLDSRPAPAPASTVKFHRYKGFVHTLDPEVVGRMATFLSAGLRRGALRPTVDTVLTFDQIADAHRRIEAGAHRGKIVLSVE